MLNGVPFDRTLPVGDIAPNAGYLPRTWAKLEIDRLLAEDAGKNRQTITDLSKAMYVMTPFTSLLVLENEAMYKEFNVDRGRKDHWAMYPCPEKIPTVYIPDANQPAHWNAVQFATRKPHENVVRQTIVMRGGPEYLKWPIAINGRAARPDIRWMGQFNINGTGSVEWALRDYQILFDPPSPQRVFNTLDSEKMLEARMRKQAANHFGVNPLYKPLPTGGTAGITFTSVNTQLAPVPVPFQNSDGAFLPMRPDDGVFVIGALTQNGLQDEKLDKEREVSALSELRGRFAGRKGNRAINHQASVQPWMT
jgi:hypothetical protein